MRTEWTGVACADTRCNGRCCGGIWGKGMPLNVVAPRDGTSDGQFEWRFEPTWLEPTWLGPAWLRPAHKEADSAKQAAARVFGLVCECVIHHTVLAMTIGCKRLLAAASMGFLVALLSQERFGAMQRRAGSAWAKVWSINGCINHRLVMRSLSLTVCLSRLPTDVLPVLWGRLGWHTLEHTLGALEGGPHSHGQGHDACLSPARRNIAPMGLPDLKECHGCNHVCLGCHPAACGFVRACWRSPPRHQMCLGVLFAGVRRTMSPSCLGPLSRRRQGSPKLQWVGFRCRRGPASGRSAP